MNRQVPLETYLIIGRGRLAQHLCHYFDLKNIPYLQWSRRDFAEDTSDELVRLVPRAKKILLAINDSAIEPFILEHRLPVEKNVHFSGVLSTPLATQLHPLMTFGKDLYEISTYEKISFVSPNGSAALGDLIPELNNAHYFIPTGNEALYHALCVLAGNGTSLLWQLLFTEFQQRFHIPPSAVTPYLEQITQNLKKDYTTALTGPWTRNDTLTIHKNRAALSNLDLDRLYQALAEVAMQQPLSPQTSRPSLWNQNNSGVYL